ncbi:hypothetical protein [Kitasatospora aureofaciens]|uniref:hypothetical protein n=1 Tax=Kitasatospora aureofaciens TaxID=1894 RepID=UPI0005252F91|nr:hypothetical protein [Kitasatospora aureofaciens]
MNDTRVHIAADGAASINDDSVTIPGDVDTTHAVLHHLTLEAAGLGEPLAAAITDDRTGQQFRLQINPDGSADLLAPGEPLRHHPTVTPPQPHSADPDTFPAEHRQALQAVHTAGRAHDFPTATSHADRLLQDITHTHGHHHAATLTTAQVRADLAWMSADFRYATELWTFIAEGWAQTLGPTSRQARFSIRQATASWRYTPDSHARETGPALLAALEAIAPTPQADRALAAIRTRLAHLDATPPEVT